MTVKVCWGIFDLKGNWQPNYKLNMPAIQQYAENVANGYIGKDK